MPPFHSLWFLRKIFILANNQSLLSNIMQFLKRNLQGMHSSYVEDIENQPDSLVVGNITERKIILFLLKETLEFLSSFPREPHQILSVRK